MPNELEHPRVGAVKKEGEELRDRARRDARILPEGILLEIDTKSEPRLSGIAIRIVRDADIRYRPSAFSS